MYLIDELGVDPSHILVVTFTRKAVEELRERILPSIPQGDDPPRVSTLHGFALRQLLRNADLVNALPKPLRVADDWEEAEIIVPDLQRLLNRTKKQVAADLAAMSADWDSLTDAELQIDGTFIAAWRRIRDVYGFTLRAEMVYRLKRAMEQHGEFELEGQFKHVIVDEFQDLNACDLAIIRSLAGMGASVFCAGDDDQSIYGFRQASPAGIRSFTTDYADTEDHKLSLCKRCDRAILDAAEYVANQDLQREPKALKPENGGGVVRLYSNPSQTAEATRIAKVCRELHDANHAYPAIAVLLRSDYLRRFSRPVVDALKAAEIPVAAHGTAHPLTEQATRRLYALARLTVSPEDSLAVRTLLQLTPGIGDGCIVALEGLAVQRVERYAATVRAVALDPTLLPPVGSRVAKAWSTIEAATKELSPFVEPVDGVGLDELRAAFAAAADLLQVSSHAGDDIFSLIGEPQPASLSDLLSRTMTVSDRLEPQLSTDSVNIMTMHQAKGLTFDCVLIPGLEDELLPGKHDDPEEEGDERRLLYVSMTRARHALALFYATRRTGAQEHSGRRSTGRDRKLTRFLADYKFREG